MLKIISINCKILNRKKDFNFIGMIVLFNILLLFGCQSPNEKMSAVKQIDKVNYDTVQNSVDTSQMSSIVAEAQSDTLDTLDYFYKEIATFKEVIAKQKELGQNKLQYFLRDTFDEPEKYYWLQVGYDNGVRMVVVYNFFCYPKSKKIYYLNTETEKTTLVKNGKW